MATRTEYYRQLAAASRSGGDVRPFLVYALQGLVDGLSEQIKRLHKQAELWMWRSVVDRTFGNHTSSAAQRQRLVAIELATAGPTPRAGIRTLTPEIAGAYGSRTHKTVTRDINRLRTLALIEAGPGPLRPRLEIVRGMRPFSAEIPPPAAATR
jgi:hypothetical protein